MAAKSKNRPSWRIPMRKVSLDSTFPGYQSRFGDGHPNRRQCVAVARRTGERCRHDAMQGAACCRSHGGYKHAARAAGVSVTTATPRHPRQAMARIGSGDAPDGFPADVALPLSPVERGRLYEAWRNRALSPGEWMQLAYI